MVQISAIFCPLRTTVLLKEALPLSGHEINPKTHLEGKQSLLFLITELETRTFPGSLNEECETVVKFTPIFPLNIFFSLLNNI